MTSPRREVSLCQSYRVVWLEASPITSIGRAAEAKRSVSVVVEALAIPALVKASTPSPPVKLSLPAPPLPNVQVVQPHCGGLAAASAAWHAEDISDWWLRMHCINRPPPG